MMLLQNLNEMYEDFTKHFDCNSNTEVTTINNLHDNNIKLKQQFKDALKTLVAEVRCKSQPDADIHILIDRSVEINRLELNEEIEQS